MKKRSLFTHLGIVIAIVVIASLISSQLYFRIDFTEDKRYTLSEATGDVLDELDGVITVTAYFSEDLPAQLINNKKDFEDMLIEYEKRSGENVVYEFVNPNENQEKETEVQQRGIGPVMVNVTENDRIEQMRAYMGATLQLDDKVEIIPLVQPGSAMEYALTTSIKKLSIQDKPKVGLLQGHGEAGLRVLPQLVQQLRILYEVEELQLTDTTQIPSHYRALAWVAPKDSIPANRLAKLSAYLNNGGKLFVAYTNVTGDMQQGLLSVAPDIGLVSWLNQQGVQLGQHFVTDAQCASVTVQQRQGFFTINSNVEFPYFPRVSNFEDHPMTRGLEQVTLPFVTGVTPTVDLDTALKATPLLYTSSNSGLIVAPAYIDIQKKWAQNDFGSGIQSLAIAIEGFGNGGKLIVIGNGDFFTNGEEQSARTVAPDNLNLASNAIDWLADDTGLIHLRTKAITSRPLEVIEDSTREMLKYANVFAPIVLLLVYAFVRRLRNQRKRQRWMQGNFE